MSEPRSVRVADIKAVAGFRPWGQSAVEPEAASIAEPEPRESPFDQGYRQGQWDAEQSFGAERARYRELIAACEAIQPEPSEMLALLIAESVETLVRATVGEVALDVDTLLARARCAASMVAEADGERLLCLHPDDLALLDNCDLPLPASADATVRPGSLRVEHPTGWIEDGIAVRLDALREQLGLREPAE
jgi:flagellar biosynthesis/type III secretory pathway protein FliH